MQNLKYINNELENELKASHQECRQLKQEILKLNQLNAQLKEQLAQTKVASDIEEQFKFSLIENKQLRKELEYLQCQEMYKIEQIASKPSYEQIELELNDLQSFFKKYYNLQEQQNVKQIRLLNQLPIQLLRECWLAINQTFKSNFNTNQSLQSLQDEVQLLEQDYKQLLHSKQECDDFAYQARQCTITERRVEIERCRKEIQCKQQEIKKQEIELGELQKEFSYICKIEQRRFNQQLEMEKQLLTIRQKTEQPQTSIIEQKVSVLPVQRSRQHSDYLKSQIKNDSQQSIKPLQIMRAPRQSEQECEKSNLERTIDQTRLKLSRQLSQASNLRESRK